MQRCEVLVLEGRVIYFVILDPRVPQVLGVFGKPAWDAKPQAAEDVCEGKHGAQELPYEADQRDRLRVGAVCEHLGDL